VEDKLAITLINIARPPRMLTYNLELSEFQKKLRYLKSALDNRGKLVLRREGKVIAGSITFPARGTKGSKISGLPDIILKCSEIDAAIKKRELRAVKD
jgi:hypothetical protein